MTKERPEPPEPPYSRQSGLSHAPRQNYTIEGRSVRVASEEELKNLPPGAVRLSRREVIAAADRYKWRKEGKAWRRMEDFFPLYSGLPAFMTSCYFVSLVRHKFKLGRYHARGIQYFSASIFPAVYTPIAAIPLIAEPAMIKEFDCADCLGIRMGLLQVAGAVIWAASFASIGSLYYAKRYHTVPLPPISPRYAKDFAKILSQPYIPAVPMILAHSVAQFLIGYVGGIKYWYRGQELNFTEAYVAQESRKIYGVDAPHPEFFRTKVQADWWTEKIATFSLRNFSGRAVAADHEDGDEEDDDFMTTFYKYTDVRYLSQLIFGK